MNGPPSYVYSGVERFAPGFWASWSRAVQHAWNYAGGFSVTSWYRTPDYNESVGGAEGSQHLLGVAFDAQARDLTRLEAGLRSAGFQTIRYARHVHAQPWPAGTARPILRALGLSAY